MIYHFVVTVVSLFIQHPFSLSNFNLFLKASTNKQLTATEEQIDIDLEDPEVEQAALKIQAGFKGMKTRKELQSRKAVSNDLLVVRGSNYIIVKEAHIVYS